MSEFSLEFNVKREQEQVQAYHYDMRVPDVDVETEINVGLTPMTAPEEANLPEENTIIMATLNFRLVFDDFVVSGAVSQVNHIIDRKIEEQTDLAPSEIDTLVEPLFDMVQRLTYEVTEIARDEPGINVTFASQSEQNGSNEPNRPDDLDF